MKIFEKIKRLSKHSNKFSYSGENVYIIQEEKGKLRVVVNGQDVDMVCILVI